MGRLETIRAAATAKDFYQGQLLHAGLIVLLVAGAVSMLHEAGPRFLGWDARAWAICSISLAVVHQVIVAVVFRAELYAGVLTRLLGARAIPIWTAIFLPFLIARPVTVFIVGWLDQTPITGFRGLELIVGLALVALAVVTMHSVLKHFTVRRAVGADHFDNAVIDMPFVKEGMFKYTSNAMYGLVFLGLWGIALAFGSWNALAVAVFQHVYIWVHMVVTEQPDINRIYGQ